MSFSTVSIAAACRVPTLLSPYRCISPLMVPLDTPQLPQCSVGRKLMADLVRYSCPRELVPCIEAALAANGYIVAESSLREDSGCAVADIEVWGAAACAAVHLLESLPYTLTRHACSRS
jgi:hypothetical protein